MLPSNRKRLGSDGMTLLELLVVVSIIAILAVLLVPNISGIINKAEGVVCTSRLKNLWSTFSAYMHDGHGWPQVPPGIKIGSLQEQQWWLDMSSSTMDLTKKSWQCPTIARATRGTTKTPPGCLISYLPTLFDDKPGTAFRWSQMPWFTEIGDAHGKGSLMIRTDGSVDSSGQLQ